MQIYVAKKHMFGQSNLKGKCKNWLLNSQIYLNNLFLLFIWSKAMKLDKFSPISILEFKNLCEAIVSSIF